MGARLRGQQGAHRHASRTRPGNFHGEKGSRRPPRRTRGGRCESLLPGEAAGPGTRGDLIYVVAVRLTEGKERVPLAAHRTGFRHITLPQDNGAELAELPEQLHGDMTCISAGRVAGGTDGGDRRLRGAGGNQCPGNAEGLQPSRAYPIPAGRCCRAQAGQNLSGSFPDGHSPPDACAG